MADITPHNNGETKKLERSKGCSKRQGRHAACKKRNHFPLSVAGNRQKHSHQSYQPNNGKHQHKNNARRNVKTLDTESTSNSSPVA